MKLNSLLTFYQYGKGKTRERKQMVEQNNTSQQATGLANSIVTGIQNNNVLKRFMGIKGGLGAAQDAAAKHAGAYLGSGVFVSGLAGMWDTLMQFIPLLFSTIKTLQEDGMKAAFTHFKEGGQILQERLNANAGVQADVQTQNSLNSEFNNSTNGAPSRSQQLNGLNQTGNNFSAPANQVSPVTSTAPFNNGVTPDLAGAVVGAPGPALQTTGLSGNLFTQ